MIIVLKSPLNHQEYEIKIIIIIINRWRKEWGIQLNKIRRKSQH